MKLVVKLFSIALILHFSINSKAQNLTQQKVYSLLYGNIPAPVEQPDNFSISSAYSDAATGLQYVYLQQTHQQIRVYNAIRNLVYNNQNQLLHTSGNFIEGLIQKAANAYPTLTARQAVEKALQHLNLSVPSSIEEISNTFSTNKKISFQLASVSKKAVTTELIWITNNDGQSVELAYTVNIKLKQQPHWYNIQIDAQTGNYLSKDDWIVSCNFGNCNTANHKHLSKNISNNIFSPLPPPLVTTANYKVVPLPFESPNHGAVAVESNPWLKAGTGNNATTNGWHFDGFDNYDITRGNNVFAYEDTSDLDIPGQSDTSSTTFPNLNFISTPNFLQSPYIRYNQKFQTTNLFYWNNIIHDVLYQYGFTEVSGNFQNYNLERGGTGNDYVLAEAQDGSGLNNANFGTPPDGDNGVMQMYLWTGNGGVTVTSPSSIAGNYSSTESAFSTNNKLANLGSRSGQVVIFKDDAQGTTTLGCDGPAANDIAGKIALITRGGCNFTVKVKNAQNSGAIAAIVVNNVSGGIITMGGTDNTITIPAVLISDVDGATIATQVNANQIVNATLNAAVDVDGDVDNGVVSHEFGHGVSNRLTGGPANASCLNNAEQAGEGWSDYLALMLTTNWATTTLADATKSRGMGTYAIGEPITGVGIRAYPYNTDMNINPLTYFDMISNGQVHFIGTIWCTVLWDMTWNMIKMDGINPSIYNATAAQGNVRALRLVMEGMRLQTCRPGFLDCRDAILAADSILYNGRYKCAIWKAFAKRGMGFSASQGSSSSTTDGVDAYDVPTGVTLNKAITTRAVNSGQQITINIQATCQCEVPQNNFVIKDTIPSALTYVSNTGGGTLSGNILTYSGINFANELETKNYSITLLAGTGCAIDTAINDNREANTKGGLAGTIISGAANWAASTTLSNSGTSSWYASNPAGTSNVALSSSSFSPKALSILQFNHYYETENKLDGAVVEISSNGGSNWSTANPYFIRNGYNGSTTATGSSFTGVSYDKFITSIVNLSHLNGNTTTRARFRLQTNNSNVGSSTYKGWYIDDIMQMNGCGGINKTVLLNSSNTKVDEIATPIFVRPAGLPLQLLQFNTEWDNPAAVLNWVTTNEVNVSHFDIQRSFNGKDFSTIAKAQAKGAGSYNYTDYPTKTQNAEIVYYRLAIIDKDGSLQYSTIKTINIKQPAFGISLFPNPASTDLQIILPNTKQQAELTITDVTGKKLFQKAFVANDSRNIGLPVSTWANGMYQATVLLNDGTKLVKKFMVRK